MFVKKCALTMTLCKKMKQAITKLCPASIPLIPAYMLIEFVQNTASMPM